VGTPAPFRAELPERLIRQHTYAGESVLDPFGGAVRPAWPRFIGCDVNNRSIDRARKRLAVGSQTKAA
jgi:DNA modification methylase